VRLPDGPSPLTKHALAGLAFFTTFALTCALLIFVASRFESCRTHDVPPLHPIDAGVQLTRIDQRLDAAVQAEQAALQEIRERHDAAIVEFTDAQRAEWERVSAQGDRAVEAWINDWYRRQRGGRP
jgi:hypothetical protein